MSEARGVLVSGASTGIGFATALRLAETFRVFAGVRAAGDARKLREARARITPLVLDVCDSTQIAAAVQTIRTSGTPLHGLVNNAGIAVAGPLEYLPLDELRRQFDVNVFGAVALTQAMLPMLRETHGRIVLVSSVSGQIAPPYLGPYAASKFALEALGDALRMELSAFGMHVSVVQPGNVKTPIWQKGRDAAPALVARLPQVAIEHYGAAVAGLAKLTEREERSGVDPDAVAGVIERALHEPHPSARYAVGGPPSWQRKMAALLPERWRDKLILKNFKPA